MPQKSSRAALLWLVLLSISVVASAQSSDKPTRPVPRLTSDDLPSPAGQPADAIPDAASAVPAAESVNEYGSGIGWHSDPLEASRLASSGNKLIIVDVFTDWCGWCKKMDQEIYSDPRVVALSRENVFLKLNAEDEGAGQEFARQAGVQSFPTTIILDGTGRIVDTRIGFVRTPEAFVQFVKHARASR